MATTLTDVNLLREAGRCIGSDDKFFGLADGRLAEPVEEKAPRYSVKFDKDKGYFYIEVNGTRRVIEKVSRLYLTEKCRGHVHMTDAEIELLPKRRAS